MISKFKKDILTKKVHSEEISVAKVAFAILCHICSIIYLKLS